MTVSFDLPPDLEQRLRAEDTDVNREAKETYLVELYRRDKLTHDQLGAALGLSWYDTEGVLKRHNVFDYTIEDFESDLRTAEELARRKAK
jgi:hypothetical protein